MPVRVVRLLFRLQLRRSGAQQTSTKNGEHESSPF
jgi:hypothetical protein